jgi:hypothetical protein
MFGWHPVRGLNRPAGDFDETSIRGYKAYRAWHNTQEKTENGVRCRRARVSECHRVGVWEVGVAPIAGRRR